MSIVAGQTVVAADFISASDGSTGKVPKITSGLIASSFIHASKGGTGADGALTITSGTTTVSAASAAVLIKNYTSISISGSGKLAFSNPHANGTTIFLRSQGGITLTSSSAPMVDASAMGAAAGNMSKGVGMVYCTAGSAGAQNNTPSTVTGQSFVAWSTNATWANYTPQIYNALFQFSCPGSGGNTGGTNTFNGTPGTGGRGGGALIMECAGAWNFTTASGISTAGANGTNQTGGSSGHGGGGSGGGAGTFHGLAGSVTANTGTINVSGGTGGTGFGSGGNPGATGGAAGAAVGAWDATNNNGTTTGQTGYSAFSMFALNTEFV